MQRPIKVEPEDFASSRVGPLWRAVEGMTPLIYLNFDLDPYPPRNS